MMGTTRLVRAGALLLACAALLPGELQAQYDAPPPPAAYALQNVTLVGADGTRTPGMTLVVRGGLVETLAAGADVPADARLLEGDSLLVYPGMVDAHASAEFEFPEPKDRPEDDDDITSWDPPRSVSGFTPHRRVSHHLTDTGEGVSAHLEQGVVAGMVHPTEGMAAGQPAVLVFRPDAEVPWALVDDESAGLSMGFRQGRGVYPSQLFGVIAYLRQAFLDAERYAAARAEYDRDPSGMTAPAWDPDYEALLRASRGGARVYFEADSDEDIRRVLNLADEFGFRPAIMGGREAWKLADELARRDVPVLLSVDFPRPDDWDEEADTADVELDPDAAREKEEIENARAAAGRLEAAGVRVALTSDGGIADLLEGVRTAVEYGFSESGALASVTTVPAGMIGLPALGRVVQGGGATFVVADGDLLDEESGVVYTFVEGHLREGRALGGGGGGGEPASNVSGEWEGSVSAQGMDIGLTMSLTMDPDGSLSGTAVAEGQGDADVSGSVSGTEVTIIIEAEGMPEPIRMSGTLSEDGSSIDASASTPMGDMRMSVRKKPGGAGAWTLLFGDRDATSNEGGAR